MSFASQFTGRWERVIHPAVSDVRVNDVPLEPVRVDVRMISDSILTEILDGVASCAVFLADVTSLAELDGALSAMPT
jgi:hypothetical protein